MILGFFRGLNGERHNSPQEPQLKLEGKVRTEQDLLRATFHAGLKGMQITDEALSNLPASNPQITESGATFDPREYKETMLKKERQRYSTDMRNAYLELRNFGISRQELWAAASQYLDEETLQRYLFEESR